MRIKKVEAVFLFSLLAIPLSAFSAYGLPQYINAPGEKVIVVDPRLNAWGAYSADGVLVRSGVAATGKSYCADMGRPCHTDVGTFRIRTLGDAGCKSPSFPLPKGGSPMPYCMYFNEAQALHGSYHVARAHLSHGCVRMYPSDAKWLRYNFASYGTLVVVKPY